MKLDAALTGSLGLESIHEVFCRGALFLGKSLHHPPSTLRLQEARIIPALVPKVYKQDLMWAIWRPRAGKFSTGLARATGLAGLRRAVARVTGAPRYEGRILRPVSWPLKRRSSS